MQSRKNLLKRSRLYLILNNPAGRLSLEKMASLCAKEIGIVQLRDKFSTQKKVLKAAAGLAAKLTRSKTLFIINDYPKVAAASGADGVHLGQQDPDIKKARKILGKDKIIGVSCHSLAQARRAQRQGADYIGIGPVFATTTKPKVKPIGLETAARMAKSVKIPYFAIGGINPDNLYRLKEKGIKNISVCSAIMCQADPKLAAKRLYNKLRS